MAGNKTHEQQRRNLERKPDMPDENRRAARTGQGGVTPPANPQARHSEFPVSRGGVHQESRDHNKHNNPGQSGHKPQKHGPAEEKH